jgi:hypothetical protein
MNKQLFKQNNPYFFNLISKNEKEKINFKFKFKTKNILDSKTKVKRVEIQKIKKEGK